MDLQQLTQMYDFTGRTFIVTGGTGVLGGEVVCALAGVGANVVILDRNLDPAQGLLERMGPHACNAEAVYGDVLDRASLLEAAAIIDKRFGCVHGLVNAAGGNKPTATTRPEPELLRPARGCVALRVRPEPDGHDPAQPGLWPPDGRLRRGGRAELLLDERVPAARHASRPTPRPRRG